jgi:hypothetical protein
MVKSHVLCLALVGFLVLSPTCTFAAHQSYLNLKGAKQGAYKGQQGQKIQSMRSPGETNRQSMPQSSPGGARHK